MFGRILFEKAIETLPSTVKEEILLDEDMQERWGFGIVTGVTLGSNGPSFERRALFGALRSAIEQLSAPVDVVDDRGVKWKVLVDKNERGDLEFRISNDQIIHRLVDYSALAREKELRLAWLERTSRELLFPETWVTNRRDELSGAPLSDEAFADLSVDVGSMPSSLDEEIRSDLRQRRANFHLIAPKQSIYYSRLVGQFGSQATAIEFIDEVSGPLVVSLVQEHGARGLRRALLTCGHPRISAKIPLETLSSTEGKEVFVWLSEKGDPISQLAGIELLLPNVSRFPDLEETAIQIVEALLDDGDTTNNPYNALSAVFAASMGVMAMHRLFRDAPPFYRRQAALSHASLCTRAMIEEGSDFSGIDKWLKGTGAPQIAFLQELIDLRSEPRWLPEYATPSQLRAEMIGRLSLAVQACSDDIKSAELKRLLLGPESKLAEAMEWPRPYLPGPLEGTQIEANPLPDEVLGDARRVFSGAKISPDALLRVVNFACIAGDASEISALASEALKRLDYLVDTKHSEATAFHVLVALAMAGATSRDGELARCLRILARMKRRHGSFRDEPENDVRIALIASSAFTDFQKWAGFLGAWVLEIVHSFDPKKDPTNLLTLIRQLRQLEPGLAQYLSKPEATLTVLQSRL